MKTRAEIYGNEAADLLRTVTMYLASVNSSFFVFTLAKKIRQRLCSPTWRGRAAFFKQRAAAISRPASQPKLTGRLSGQYGSCWTSFSGPITMLPLIFLSSSFSLPMANSTRWPALRTGRRRLSAMPCGAIREAAAALFWSIHRRRSPKSTVPAFPGSAP